MDQFARRRAAPILSRRWLIAGAGAALLVGGRAARAACPPTARQPEGPFYPVAIVEHDGDLTRVAGATGRAAGEVIAVTGRVTDAACRPLPGAVIELWQANMHGRYDHPRDAAGGRPLDPAFQGYARLTADADGAYRFVTIIPGAYPASADWVRPPHIHFKAHATGLASLTTQMYFAGHPLNDADALLAPLAPERRAALEVRFDAAGTDGAPTGRFDLILGA